MWLQSPQIKQLQNSLPYGGQNFKSFQLRPVNLSSFLPFLFFGFWCKSALAFQTNDCTHCSSPANPHHFSPFLVHSCLLCPHFFHVRCSNNSYNTTMSKTLTTLRRLRWGNGILEKDQTVGIHPSCSSLPL